MAIEAAIAQVNYVPNRTARSLVSRKTHAAAFIVREHTDLFFADRNLSRMAIGANATLSDAGYQMSILIVESQASADRVTELIAGGSVDGAILIAMLVDDPVMMALADAGTPLVTASTPVAGSPIPSVDTDNTTGTRLITEQLIATGRTVLAEIRGPVRAPVSAMRHAGFVAAAGRLYRPELVVSAAEWAPTAGAIAMQELLQIDPTIDGVVVACDAIAAGAIEYLRSVGRRVPEDIGIVGFDDSPWAVQTTP